MFAVRIHQYVKIEASYGKQKPTVGGKIKKVLMTNGLIKKVTDDELTADT